MARQRHELITDYSDRKLHNHRETPVSAVAGRGRDINHDASHLVSQS